MVAENRANALVGGFRTIDDDLSQTFTYTLLSDANGKFKVSRLKLHITFGHAPLDSFCTSLHMFKTVETITLAYLLFLLCFPAAI